MRVRAGHHGDPARRGGSGPAGGAGSRGRARASGCMSTPRGPSGVLLDACGFVPTNAGLIERQMAGPMARFVAAAQHRQRRATLTAEGVAPLRLGKAGRGTGGMVSTGFSGHPDDRVPAGGARPAGAGRVVVEAGCGSGAGGPVAGHGADGGDLADGRRPRVRRRGRRPRWGGPGPGRCLLGTASLAPPGTADQRGAVRFGSPGAGRPVGRRALALAYRTGSSEDLEPWRRRKAVEQGAEGRPAGVVPLGHGHPSNT